MKALGISEDVVKPVLKQLLRVFEKNWELIEDENYRALADAVFQYQETNVFLKPNFFFFALFVVVHILFYDYIVLMSQAGKKKPSEVSYFNFESVCFAFVEIEAWLFFLNII